MMVAAISSLLLSIAFKIWHDLKVHYNNVADGTAIGINHGKEALLMALVNIPCLIVLTLSSSLYWVWAALISFSMICFSIWFIFDGGYGIGKGKGFFYTGDPNYKGSANSDKFLRKLPLWLHIAIKVIGLGGSIYLYIKTYH